MRKPMGGQFTKLKLRGELKTKRLRSAEAKRRVDVIYAKDKIEEDEYWARAKKSLLERADKNTARWFKMADA